jgi:hypothetical protein
MELYSQRKAQAAPGEHLPTLGLMLVTEPVGGLSRGYYVSRVHADGAIDERDKTSTSELFTEDLSYRDYFHAGGEKESERGKPHRVIRATNISHPFRSKGSDRIEGSDLKQRWKLNIATPVWDDPKARGRVVALLILGLDVEHDLKPLLHPLEFRKPADDGTGYGIDEKVKVVVADHRGRWVWHKDCEEVLRSDRPEFREPQSYPELVRAQRLTDAQAGPWLRLDVPPDSSAGKYEYSGSDGYIDPVETAVRPDRDAEPEIASFTRFDPYEHSRYHGLDASGSPGPPRRWVFVAQVDRKSALRPLDEMRRDILRGGVLVVAALAVLAAGLWVGLVMVLRRLEFGSHG